MAHLQTHQVGQKDRPRQGAETPAQVSPSHSPVSSALRLLPVNLTSNQMLDRYRTYSSAVTKGNSSACLELKLYCVIKSQTY